MQNQGIIHQRAISTLEIMSLNSWQHRRKSKNKRGETWKSIITPSYIQVFDEFNTVTRILKTKKALPQWKRLFLLEDSAPPYAAIGGDEKIFYYRCL